jgi:ribosomal 30S subunit maturation factor RimM
VDSRDAAEALRGARIELERAALPAGDEGPFLVDLVGAEVEAPSGPVGRAVEVVVNPTVDSLIVERPDGSRVEVVLRPEYLESIDATRIVLATDDGILS